MSCRSQRRWRQLTRFRRKDQTFRKRSTSSSFARLLSVFWMYHDTNLLTWMSLPSVWRSVIVPKLGRWRVIVYGLMVTIKLDQASLFCWPSSPGIHLFQQVYRAVSKILAGGYDAFRIEGQQRMSSVIFVMKFAQTLKTTVSCQLTSIGSFSGTIFRHITQPTWIRQWLVVADLYDSPSLHARLITHVSGLLNTRFVT